MRILKLANVRKLRAAYFKLWIGVKTLGHGIGDDVSKIGKQVAKMDFERSGDVFDWSRRQLDPPGSTTLHPQERRTRQLQLVGLVPVVGILLARRTWYRRADRFLRNATGGSRLAAPDRLLR
jgi:hypothetical protein